MFIVGGTDGGDQTPTLLSPTIVNMKSDQFLYSESNSPGVDQGSGKSSIRSAISITASPHIYLCMNQNTSSLSKLKTDILSVTDSNNVIKLTVNSAKEDIQTIRKHEYDDYLEHVIGNIAVKLREMIDRSVGSQQQFQVSSINPKFDYKEVLVHLHHCVSIFNKNQPIGMETPLAKLQSYLMNGSHTEHQLVIIKGTDDNEVSCASVQLCHKVRDLFGKEVILIPIFVGLTTKSNSIGDIFHTICSQINIILNQDVNIEGYCQKKLTSYFLGLINRVSKSCHHLFICIDGIDKIPIIKDRGYDSFDWLACRLPPKCHIVVSCASMENLSTINYLETKLLSSDGIVHIENLSTEDCKSLIDQTLSLQHRRLSDKQYNTVINAISQTESPTVIGYLSKLSLSWASDVSTGVNDDIVKLPSSVEGMVEHILTKIETVYGRTVSMTLFSYVTLARYGVTEVELLDLLSSKDSVLLALYQHQEPLVMRFSSHAWIHIMRILGE